MGSTSMRCHDFPPDGHKTQLQAGMPFDVTWTCLACHPGDCYLYLSYDDDTQAPTNFFKIAEFPGCGATDGVRVAGHPPGAQLHNIDVKDNAKVHGSLMTHPQQPQQRLNLGVALGIQARAGVPHGARLHEPAVRAPARVSGLGKDVGCDKRQLWCNRSSYRCKL